MLSLPDHSVRGKYLAVTMHREILLQPPVTPRIYRSTAVSSDLMTFRSMLLITISPVPCPSVPGHEYHHRSTTHSLPYAITV